MAIWAFTAPFTFTNNKVGYGLNITTDGSTKVAKLTFEESGALGLAISTSLNLGGSLTLGGDSTNGGTVTFAEGTTPNLTSESRAGEGRTLVPGGTIHHSLTTSSLVIDGKGFSDWKDDYRVRISDSNGNLTVSILEGAQNFVWSGTTDGNWNASAYNWEKGDMRFEQNDTVTFGATAATKAVTVAEAGVTADALTVDGACYSFSGGARLIPLRGKAAYFSNRQSSIFKQSHPLDAGVP